MHRHVITIIDKYKQYFPVIVKLLGSGLLTSLGFVLLSSGKFNYISNELSINILLFIQFQITGITISKFGLDSLVFAKMIGNTESIYDPLEYIKSKGFLLSFLCAVVYALMYDDYVYALIIFFTVICEVYSIVVIVQMNIMKHYGYAFFTNIVAYPLFFSVLLISSLFYEYTYGGVIILYTLCIFLRFLCSWIFVMNKKKENIQTIKMKVPFNLGIQQLLSFNLFKTDQIIISLGAASLVFWGLTNQDVQQILFLSKFRELVAAVLSYLSILYTPYLIIESRDGFVEILNKYKWIWLFYVVGLISVFFIYLFIWHDKASLDFVYVSSYSVVSVLIIFASMIIYGYLKKDEINILVKNLLISSGIGVIFLGLVFLFGKGKYMVCVVPIQMLFFVILRLQNKK